MDLDVYNRFVVEIYLLLKNICLVSHNFNTVIVAMSVDVELQ